MNWLKNRIRNWVNSDPVPRALNSSMNMAKSEETGLGTEPLRLSIYRANGGTVVETRQYDRQKDRGSNQLHIVGHDEDLGHSLSKIITMESLRG
jgi:hypothetical protein